MTELKTEDLIRDRGTSAGRCTHCGDCCRVPGTLLPEQVDLLSAYLHVSRRELFDRYLIAELCTPAVELPPVFMLAPVKAEEDGRRSAHRLLDLDYRMTAHLACIFRAPARRRCTIHRVKPFGCRTMICSRMTGSQPIAFDKSFYYPRWRGRQDLIFSILPELAPVAARIARTVAGLEQAPGMRREVLAERDRLLRIDVAQILTGRSTIGVPLGF